MKNLLYYIFFALFTILSLTSCGGGSQTVEKKDNLYNFNDDDSIYETAEDGLVSRWQTWAGFDDTIYDKKHIENVNFGANGSKKSIFIRKEWIDGHTNLSNFQLPFYNDSQFILEFDQMKKDAHEQYCFIVGIKADTDLGKRFISFSTFFDMKGWDAKIETYDNGITELNFPLSMKYVNQANVWHHLRFDLNSFLHKFEPENNINAITAFYFQGGDDYLDNIRLVSK